jgi:hypothetical protein
MIRAVFAALAVVALIEGDPSGKVVFSFGLF